MSEALDRLQAKLAVVPVIGHWRWIPGVGRTHVDPYLRHESTVGPVGPGTVEIDDGNADGSPRNIDLGPGRRQEIFDTLRQQVTHPDGSTAPAPAPQHGEILHIPGMLAGLERKVVVVPEGTQGAEPYHVPGFRPGDPGRDVWVVDAPITHGLRDAVKKVERTLFGGEPDWAGPEDVEFSDLNAASSTHALAVKLAVESGTEVRPVLVERVVEGDLLLGEEGRVDQVVSPPERTEGVTKLHVAYADDGPEAEVERTYIVGDGTYVACVNKVDGPQYSAQDRVSLAVRTWVDPHISHTEKGVPYPVKGFWRRGQVIHVRHGDGYKVRVRARDDGEGFQVEMKEGDHPYEYVSTHDTVVDAITVHNDVTPKTGPLHRFLTPAVDPAKARRMNHLASEIKKVEPPRPVPDPSKRISEQGWTWRELLRELRDEF